MNRFLILFLIIILTANLYSSEGMNDSLTIKEAIKIALEKNLNLRSFKISLHSSKLNMLSSRYSLYPSAAASLSGSENTQADLPFSSNSNSLNGKASIGINYDLSISKFKNYSADKEYFKATLYENNSLQKEIIAEVIKEYIQIVKSLKNIELEQENVVYHQRKLEEIEILVNYGRKSKTDILQQQANLSSAKYRLLNVDLQYKQNLLEFTTQLLLPEGNYYLDTSIISNFISRLNDKNTFTIGDSLPETDNIKAQKNKIVSSKLLLDAAQLNYLPALSLYSGASIDKRIINNELFYQTDGNPSVSFNVGISLEIPIFDRKQRWLQIEKAKNSFESSKIELEREIQTLNFNIKKELLNDTLIGEKIVVGLSSLNAAKEALDAMEERYRNGLATLTELTAAQTTFLEANLSLLNAQVERIICRVNILYYLDKIEEIPLVADVIKMNRGKE